MKTRMLTALALLIGLAILLNFYSYKFCLAVIFIICSIIQVEWESLMPNRLLLQISQNQNEKSKNKALFFQSVIMFIGNILFAYVAVSLCISNFNTISIFIISSLIGIFWLICSLYALYKPIYTLSNISRKILYRILPNLTTIALLLAVLILLNNGLVKNYSLLLFTLPLVWLTDSMAYFIGRKFGRKKLAPNISPKKSVEGAIGGIICATIIVSYAYYHINLSINIYMIIYFLGLSLVSILGDLFQSRLKREFNIKDSSQLLPGHGGFFDRFDAAVPVILFSIYVPNSIFIDKIIIPNYSWL